MHDRYIKYQSEWQPIPDIPNHSISVDGRVRNDKTGKILSRIVGYSEPTVWIVTDEWSGEGLVAHFVMSVYKPINIPIQIARGKVYYEWVDSDRENCHAGNLVWLFREPVGVPNREGYFYIPDFTKYGISVYGDVISLIDGRECVATTSTDGYVSHSFTSDWGVYSNSNGRHRSIAMTFNGYPKEIYSMVCNHLNGVPGDDRPENVEMCTYSDNINHAYATGLRSDNIHVAIRDHVEKTDKVFYSYGRAAEDIGCTPSNILYVLKQDPDYLFKDRWQIMRCKPGELPDFPTPTVKVVHGRPSTIHLWNPETNETKVIIGVIAAAEFMGVERNGFAKYLNDNSQRPHPVWRAKLTTWTPWKTLIDSN